MHPTAVGRHGDRTHTADSGEVINLARYHCATRPLHWRNNYTSVTITPVEQSHQWNNHISETITIVERLHQCNNYTSGVITPVEQLHQR